MSDQRPSLAGCVCVCVYVIKSTITKPALVLRVEAAIVNVTCCLDWI